MAARFVMRGCQGMDKWLLGCCKTFSKEWCYGWFLGLLQVKNIKKIHFKVKSTAC